MSEPIVRVIKANPFNLPNQTNAVNNKLNVAAYARVSTDHEEQEDSFERQVDYYTRFIQSNPNWNFVKVYSDPGISGTRAEKRPGFQEMINDCRNGLVNRILVKSIARFARNTVDALNYIRELKELGVSVYFESQNIDTMSAGGDILLTILAATAEEESRTISKNVRWAYQKKFQKGDFVFDYTHFLGFIKDNNGKFIIVEEEAQIVRRIFREFLSGVSISEIAIRLQRDKVKTGWGREKWYYGTVKSMIQNEKYYGAVHMGKTFKPDVLSKKRLKNEGQVESYYAENVLPQIIDKSTWELAQSELKRRENIAATNHLNSKYNTKYPFSRMIKCGTCGAFYTRCNNCRDNGTRVPSWWCTNRRNGGDCCNSGIKESAIEAAYLEVLNQVIEQIDDIKSVVKNSIGNVIVSDPHDVIDKINEKINDIQEEMMQLHKSKINGLITPSEYAIKGSRLSEKIDQLKIERDKLENDYNSASLRNKRISDMYDVLDSLKPTQEFNVDIFRRMIDMIVVNGKKLTFVFKCGIEKKIQIRN